MSTIKIYVFIFIGIFLFSQCNQDGEKSPEPDMHAHEDENHHEDEENTVHLSAEQMERIDLTLGKITGRNLRRQLKVNGHLQLPPQNKAEVSSMMGGVVQTIYVRPGEYVKKGERLARLSHFDAIDLQERYLTSKARIQYLEKEMIRKQELVEKEVAPVKDLEKIRSELEELKAKQAAAIQKMRLLGFTPDNIDADNLQSTWYVRAPIPGYVRDIFTNTGINIPSNESLFEIVDNHHIHIDLMVYEKDIPHIEVGQEVDFVLQSRPKERMKARVFAIGKAIEEEERAITVHAEIDNPDGKLLPGMYVEGRIELEKDVVPTLPEEAIAEDRGLHFVFVKTHSHDDEVLFKKIQVKTGVSDLGYVEVRQIDDFPDRPEVVVKGAYFLMAQSKLDQGEGPVHSH